MNNTKNSFPIAVNGSMVKVRVKYFGSFRETTNQNEADVEISPDATVHELLQNLSSIYGETFKNEVFQENGKNFRDDFMVSINGTLADHEKIMSTRIVSGDVIMLLPIFIGGG